MKEKLTKGFINSEDEMSMSTVNEFKRHSSRPVVGIFCTTGRTKLGMAAKRNKFKGSAMGATVHGTTVRRIATVDYLFDVFHNNGSWLKVIFNDFIIIIQYLLYYVHEIIMKQNEAKNKPQPLKIEGQGS